jgi:hypothetical protein
MEDPHQGAEPVAERVGDRKLVDRPQCPQQEQPGVFGGLVSTVMPRNDVEMGSTTSDANSAKSSTVKDDPRERR